MTKLIYLFRTMLLCLSLFTLPAIANSTLSQKEITNLEGSLEIRAMIMLEGKESIQYVLITSNNTHYYLQLNGHPKNWHSGDQILIKRALVLPDANGAKQLRVNVNDIKITSINKVNAIPAAFGPQKTIVFVVNFVLNPVEPWSLSSINGLVFNTVNQMYFENSYKQTTIVGDTVGYYTLPIDGQSNCNTMIDQVPVLTQQMAEANGINLANYTRRIYIFPRNTSCGWAGLGTIGMSGAGYSKSWINGYTQPYVTSHELGHNMGLWHANRLQCTTSPITNCTKVEYGDKADTMGAGPISHFNAFHKERLGWLNYNVSPPIKTLTASEVVAIDPYETVNTKVKAIKILKSVLSNGTRDYYYIEFRQGIGMDAPLATCGTNCDFTKGVLFHVGNSVNANSSDALDMSYNDNNPSKVALLPGQTFTDPNAANGGIKVTLNSVSAAGAIATILINNQPPACVRRAFTYTITPATRTIPVGGNATYTVSLRNNDGAGCSNSLHKLTTTIPPALTGSLNRTYLALQPGQTATAILTLNAPSATATPGTYTVPVKAQNMNTVTPDLVVNAALTVTQ